MDWQLQIAVKVMNDNYRYCKTIIKNAYKHYDYGLLIEIRKSIETIIGEHRKDPDKKRGLLWDYDSDMTELIERIKMSEIYDRVGPENNKKSDKA